MTALPTSPDRTLQALIVVDCQKDFCEGGALEVPGGNALCQKIADYICEAHDQYDMIILTQDWHVDPGAHFSGDPDFVDSWPPHCRAFSNGAFIHPLIAGAADESYIVRKGKNEAAYSGFEGFLESGESLESLLLNCCIRSIDVVGIATDHCVYATARDGHDLGFDVSVLSEMCVGVSADASNKALQDLAHIGCKIAALA